MLVFGESRNDRRSITHLIEALCPELAGRVRARPFPVSLQKTASARSVSGWMERVSQVVTSHSQPVTCVFVHRDADGPGPAGRLQQATEDALRAVGIPGAHAVVPVEEIEAWWLLFPDATERLRRSWRGTLQRSHRDWDMITDPKGELRRRTARGDRRHGYSECPSLAVDVLPAEAALNAQVAAGDGVVGR